MSDNELRAYLLGQITEDEAVRLEGRLLEDDELYHVLESVEDDLFDDHARGRLEPADRARFEARYGADGERQRFARALAKRATAASIVEFRPKPTWRRWTPLAAAAAVVIAIGGMLVERQFTPGPPAEVPSPAPSFAREVAFAVSLGSSRAAGEPMILSIGRDVTTIQLRVRLNAADRFDTYAAELRSAKTDAQTWSEPGLKATIDNGDLVIAARIPAVSVADGAYELGVRGVRAGATAGTGDDLGFVALKVVRVP